MENGNKVRIQTYFAYPVDRVTVASGGVATAVLRIESATDFIWFKSTYMADPDPIVSLTEATQIIPAIDVQIQVSGADRNLFQQPIAIPNAFGSGRIPFVLPKPMVLLANSEVRFDFTSRDTVSDFTIQLALHGLKDFGELTRPPAQ